MIQNILNLLQFDEFYGKTDNIEIAKGKYHIPSSIKEAYKQGKRQLKTLKNGRKEND